MAPRPYARVSEHLLECPFSERCLGSFDIKRAKAYVRIDTASTSGNITAA